MESRLSKLVQEGAAFLRAGDSSKPFRFGKLGRFRNRLPQDEFRSKDTSAGSHNPGELSEYLTAGGVLVEDSVDQGHVNRRLRQRKLFRIATAKRDTSSVCGGGLPGAREHRAAEVDPEHVSGRSDQPGRDQAVEACPASEVEHDGSGGDCGRDG